MPDDEEFNNNDNDDNTKEDLTANANKPTTTTVRKKRQPNFVKSNSLGLLVEANTHSYHGPAMLNWEGGTLCQLYQHKTIQRLLDDCVREEQNENQTSREMADALKVYGSRQMAEEAILRNQPIRAVLDHKDLLHILMKKSLYLLR